MLRRVKVANRIHMAREEMNLTQDELGKFFKCSGVNISRIERGLIGIEIEDLERLANILGKPLQWFFLDDVDIPQRPLELILREAQERYNVLNTVEIPLYGILPAQHLNKIAQDFIHIPRSQFDVVLNKGTYALKVVGDSLKGVDIHSGDFIIVDPDPAEINGKLCIVQIGDTIVGRLIQTNGDKIKLTSMNGTQETTEEESPRILGRIILSGGWRRH